MTVHTVFIDSRDRDFDAFPTPTAYKVRLPRNYYNVTSARLMSAEIPRSFYEFTAAAGRTSFDIVVKGGSGAYTITIPDGNYTFMSMKTSLESALAYATGLTWTVLFSSTTNRMTMFNVELVDFSVTCAPQTDRPTDWGLAYYLGFAAGTTGNSSSGSLTSPLPARFHTTMYALLDIDLLGARLVMGNNTSLIGQAPYYSQLSSTGISNTVPMITAAQGFQIDSMVLTAPTIFSLNGNVASSQFNFWRTTFNANRQIGNVGNALFVSMHDHGVREHHVSERDIRHDNSIVCHERARW